MENFTYGVSTKMLKNEKFFHMNEKNLARLDPNMNEKNDPSWKGNGGVSWGVTHKLFSNLLSTGEK